MDNNDIEQFESLPNRHPIKPRIRFGVNMKSSFFTIVFAIFFSSFAQAADGVATISDDGTPAEGETLTAGISDADGLTGSIFTYQWNRGGVAILGATLQTYDLVQLDVNTAITVTVSYTDELLNPEVVTSASTALIENVNNPVTGTVTINNTTPAEGDTLTASDDLADIDGLGTFVYQWKSGATNVGTNATTYLTSQADVGSAITVTISFNDVGGSPETKTSAATANVTNVNNPVTGTVTIDNLAPAEGDTLTASDNLVDLDGLGTFVYQWKSGGADVGTDAPTYTTTQSDVGNAITVTISFNDVDGFPETATSAATAVVGNVNDVGVATINNLTPSEGQTLSVSVVDADGTTGSSFSYVWKRNTVAIGGATAATYDLVQADVGTTITVTVDYTDDLSSAESITSGATATVDNTNNTPTGSVTITGAPTEGETLTANNMLTDTDGIPSVVNYQWKRSGSSISGATAATYVLVQADVGKAVTVTLSYTDLQNTSESVTSNSTVAIANVNDTPTGSVIISGTKTEDQTLTASNTLMDEDGIGSISYQWKRGANNISDATSSIYVLVQDDVGNIISVTASYTDAENTAESVTSNSTVAIANVNDTPTGSVIISGTKTEGQTLTASNTLMDEDGIGSISYQWKRGANNISDATSSIYVLVQDDVGNIISVTASYTDAENTVESVASNSTVAIANVNNDPTGDVTISGTLSEGQTLTASNNLIDADGLGSVSYQWKRSGTNIGGATSSTYLLAQADVGKAITVTASYTDGFSTPESVTSNSTGLIANVNDVGVATIPGAANRLQGQTLAVSVTDGDGVPASINYQWKRNGAPIGGATSSTYVLTQSDVGKAITVTASYTDLQSTFESVTSALVGVLNINDVGSVTISGTLFQGQTLAASVTDPDGVPGSINYQWRRDGAVIVSTTSSTYVLVEADNDKRISVTANYDDLQGTSESITSIPTAKIGNVNDVPTGNVIISGTKTEGQILTVSNTLADADGLGSISYQWKRNTVAISGATATTYLLKQADVSTAITVTAIYTDNNGTPESVTSSPTALIANVNDTPTGSVSISGTPTEGQTLTASNTLADEDGLGPINYQWKRNTVAISGATSSSYGLVQTDVGKAITVTASYTDLQSTSESRTSSPTPLIGNTNNAPTGSVSISGTPTEGQALTASNTLADEDGIGSIIYQWKRSGTNIGGATSSTYFLAQADVGKAITVTASYTDGFSNPESVTSSPTTLIGNTNNAPTGEVTIMGAPTEDETLTASNTLADIDGLGIISYQWKRGVNNIPDAMLSTYVLVQDDVDGSISVTASYTDSEGTAESVSSDPTVPVTNINDAPTGSVDISGTLTEGETLTVSNTLADEDGIGSIIYQWRRNGTDILGATSEEYVLTQGDVGNTLSVTASYTDADNTAESVTSDATAPIGNVNNVGALVIDGFLDVGQILTAIVTDDDVISGTISYQWKRDGVDISGETSDSYLYASTDIGKEISVTVIYTDNGGTEETFTAVATGTFSDMTPPIFIKPPEDIIVTAEGQFTSVDLGSVEAEDNIDGVFTPTSDAPAQFAPGKTPVIWTAVDAAGNDATATQTVTVRPLVDFSVDQVAAEDTGEDGTSFRILLNAIVDYDVVVPYTVSVSSTADGSDHDLVDEVATIISGRDDTEVKFTIIDDGPGEGIETIVVMIDESGLTPDAAIGAKSSITIEITEENVAPVVSLNASQAMVQTRTISKGNGVVNVSSDVIDPNTGDTPSHDWSATDNALFDIDGNTPDNVFMFDPSALSPGTYVLRLTVNDGSATADAELKLNILSDIPPFPVDDNDNDGIFDIFEANDKTNILPSKTGIYSSGLLETEAGLNFALGDIAFQASKNQANVTLADVSNTGRPSDIGFAYASGLFDFDITGLGKVGQSVTVVLPQSQAIPANASYRKLLANSWQEFVVDDNNAIASALGTSGFCPPPGDVQYQAGLTEGHFCVQLTIEDGGANDGDGAANSRISDPSGVAITAVVPKPPGSDNSNGIFGLGSLNLWWLSLFALFGLRGYCIRIK